MAMARLAQQRQRLPDELWLMVLERCPGPESTVLRDVYRFSAVCRQFHRLVNGSRLARFWFKVYRALSPTLTAGQVFDRHTAYRKLAEAAVRFQQCMLNDSVQIERREQVFKVSRPDPHSGQLAHDCQRTSDGSVSGCIAIPCHQLAQSKSTQPFSAIKIFDAEMLSAVADLQLPQAPISQTLLLDISFPQNLVGYGRDSVVHIVPFGGDGTGPSFQITVPETCDFAILLFRETFVTFDWADILPSGDAQPPFALGCCCADQSMLYVMFPDTEAPDGVRRIELLSVASPTGSLVTFVQYSPRVPNWLVVLYDNYDLVVFDLRSRRAVARGNLQQSAVALAQNRALGQARMSDGRKSNALSLLPAEGDATLEAVLNTALAMEIELSVDVLLPGAIVVRYFDEISQRRWVQYVHVHTPLGRLATLHCQALPASMEHAVTHGLCILGIKKGEKRLCLLYDLGNDSAGEAETQLELPKQRHKVVDMEIALDIPAVFVVQTSGLRGFFFPDQQAGRHTWAPPLPNDDECR
ncbi:hypothetical protein RI367_005375 [Sorochytrium milnesiophthora]